MSENTSQQKRPHAAESRTHKWHRRRQQMQEGLDRLRQRAAAATHGPRRMGAISAGMESRWIRVQKAMHGVHRAISRVAMGMAAVGHRTLRLVMPLRQMAEENSKRVANTKARWWEPVYQRVMPWLRSRRKAEFLRGVPALVFILALASGIAIVTGTRPSVTRNTALLREAQMALAEKQYDKAAITYERLLQVGGNDNEARFGLARCWAAQGDVAQASMLLRNLAPDDAIGYLPAHRVRAFLILEAPQATMSDLEVARAHLERVLASDPDDADAHGMMGTLYMKQSKIREARDEFAAAARGHPETALNAAMLSRQIGDKDAMLDFASRAAAFNKGSVKNAPTQLPAENVLSLAQALCLQKKYGEAVETIEELMGRSEKDRLVKAILEICRVWQGELDARAGADDLERFRLVKTALFYDATSREWQIRLLGLTEDTAVVRPVAIQLANQLARENAAGAEVCFFLGMEAFSRDDMVAARQMLERSLALKPGHGATANNLACAFLSGRAQDPARALKLADQSVAAAPGNPSFHETRGQALLALQRWADAAAEFEMALPGLKSRRDAYRGLAVAYEKMGFPEQAREQERLAAGER